MGTNILENEKAVYQSNYEFRLAERKAAVGKIVEKHSNLAFGNSNASIREIRLESIRKTLESTFSHS